jgi:hypothetical protein
MNTKTIQKVIRKKINEWTDSIKDSKVKKLVKQNTIVTGGAIASMLKGEPVKDFDIYFRNKETVIALAEYYVSIFNKNTGHKAEVRADEDTGRILIFIPSKGVASEDDTNYLQSSFEDVYDVLEEADESGLEEEEDIKYKPIFLSPNAITLSGKVQCVIRFYGEPEEIHETYDFIHCTNYWTSWEGKVVTNKAALESLLSGHLFYSGSEYPLCSIIRTRKFIKRGWHINAGQYLKMIFQLNELDLNDLDILEDQLIGVDSAYFTQFIDSMKAKKEKEPDFIVTQDYITSIIDRIF